MMMRLDRIYLSALVLFAALAPARAQLPPSGALIVNQTQIQGGSASQCLFINSATTPNTVGAQACGGSGTVTSVSVTAANGVSGVVATATTTPAITLTLGAITPSTVNGNTITTGTGTLTLGSVTLNAGAGGTLGSNAFTSTAYAPIASPTFTGTVTIPTLAATTINAFTLAGTIAGGGNQINNVVIGSATPLAGTFTAAVANSFVPNASTVPSNGLYLPAANTLGWAINSAAEMQLTATALSPAASGGSALGTTALPWAGLNLSSGAVINFNNGNYTLSHDNTNSILNASSVIRITSNSVGNALDMVGQLSNGSSIHRFLSNNASSVYAQFVVSSVNSGQLTIQAGGSTAMLSMDSTGLTFSNPLTFAPNLPADTAVADSTVCVASSGGKLLKGTGTLGICLGTSGRQFKTAFVPMRAGMDEIRELKLWNYRYREGFGDGGLRVQYGPTAQDVAAAGLSDLVSYDKSGSAINYDIGAFVPISLRAIQQLDRRIVALENRK